MRGRQYGKCLLVYVLRNFRPARCPMEELSVTPLLIPKLGNASALTMDKVGSHWMALAARGPEHLTGKSHWKFLPFIT